MQKVLITGGTGFLGSHITKRIIDEVESVTIATTNIRQQTTLKALGVDIDKINLVKGDIRDFDFIRLLFNEYEFDTVFHLAAISEVVKCQSDPKLAFDVNVGGTINILEVGEFELGIFTVTVNKIKTYEEELIVCKKS